MDDRDFAEESISQEEMADLQQYFRQQAPYPEEKIGIPHLLTKIFKSRDTRKAGSVGEEELERMRIYLEGSLFFGKMGADMVADYLSQQSEIVSSTSLSHQGKFLQAIITSKRDISLGEKKKPKKSFFGKPKQEGGGE